MKRPDPCGVVLAALLAGALPWLLPAEPAGAHDLQHRVTRGEAVSVELFFGDGRPFSYESYEIYRPGEDMPFQSGYSDALGRIVFLPDRPGRWRLRAFAEDGHGLDISFETDAGGIPRGARASPLSRLGRVLIGLALLFGVFGIVSLLYKRKR